MPILGIMASQISGHLWAPEGAYDSLATVTVGTAVSSITFAGIPAGYKHLQLRSIAQCTSTTSSWQRLVVAFNGDTTNANYADHLLQGNGTAGTVTATAETSTRKGFGAAAQSGSVYFVTNVTDILDYSSTVKNKVSRTLRGFENNATYSNQILAFESSLWMNTSAISSINITVEDASNLNTYSHFALYGIK